MTKTVVGSFESFDHARNVVAAIGDIGVQPGDVNVVAHDTAGRFAGGRDASAPSDPTDGALPDGAAASSPTGDTATETSGTAGSAGRGALAGGMIGGTAGLIAGLAGLALPGVGPLVAAGPIAAALTGAGLGAIAGGLIGGLRAIGVSDTDAEYYAEAVRRGGALVVVKADDARAPSIADTMRRHGAIDIESRVAAWRASGWTGFDADAEPYTREQLEREQLAYRTGGGMPQAIDRGVGSDLRSGDLRGTPIAGTPMSTDASGASVPPSSPAPAVGAAAVTGGATRTGSSVTTGTTGLGSGSVRTSEHPNIGAGSERPGVDPRSREHARRSRMDAGHDASPGGSLRDSVDRAGDAIERRIPGDSDGDGR